MKLSKSVAQDRYRDVSPNTSILPRTNFQLEGARVHLARGVWITFSLLEFVVLVLTLFTTNGQNQNFCPFIVSCTITPATAQALHHLSITPTSYFIYNLVLALLQSLVFLSVGGFIFWRKSREPVALVASFTLVNIGVWPLFPLTSYPLEVIFANVYGLCIMTALGFFLVTFPNGRFVPRWSWLLVVLWLVQAIFNEIPGPYNINSWPPLLNIAMVVWTYGGTIGILIYRYVRVFSFSQRQQAKWLLFGFGGMFALALLYILIGSVVPALGAPDSFYQLANGTLTTALFTLIPLSIAMAILHSRLWDIDVVIRRTLVYTSLTVILALIYVGFVFVFGTLLRTFLGQQQNPLVTIASTLVIAALFRPLRHGVQQIIDRRFYRRKYDAARTIEAFSATLHNEVDLVTLSEHLLAVVHETMHPVSLSLWIRPVQQASGKGARGEQPGTDRSDSR